MALIREGKPAEGIAPLKAGIAVWEASGGKVRIPILKAFLAEAMALTGDLDNALQLIDEQIAQIERPGWEERFFYAEILRLKGWMLSLKGDLEGAERNFLASLDWARRQQAKSGSCAPRPAWHDCGRAKANAKRRMSCSPRFTAGSPKASTPRICWTRRRFSPNWGSRFNRATAYEGGGPPRIEQPDIHFGPQGGENVPCRFRRGLRTSLAAAP